MKRITIALICLIFTAGLCVGAPPKVTLEISGAVTGEITISLDTDKAPITVANFINYVETGFYDGLIFHRVINNFMIQGGGFDTEMVKKTPGDAIINESSNGLINLRGTIAMARTPHPNSATSEFFINHVDNEFLDYTPFMYDGNDNAYSKYGYCVFGEVTSGMEIVDAIAATSVVDERPVADIIITNAYVSFASPVCAEKLAGDVNNDCKVNLTDICEIAINWLACNSITDTCAN